MDTKIHSTQAYMLMLMLMSRLSSLAHKLLMLMLMLASLVRTRLKVLVDKNLYQSNFKYFTVILTFL